MVTDILDAITTQLAGRFGDKYKYYMENVEQNFTTPCFTADVLQPLERSKSPMLYDRTMPVVIYYFPDGREDIKRKSYAIAEELVECLEYLPFKDTILRGENISWHMINDVLQMFITYTFATTKTSNDEGMDSIELAKVGTVN